MTEKIEWYKEVLELEPNSKVFFPLARMLANEGSIEEAIEIIEKGLVRHPEFLEARLYCIELLHKCGRLEACQAHVERLSKMLSAYGEFWRAWASCIAAMKESGSEDTASALRFLAANFLHGPVSLNKIIEEGLAVVLGENKRQEGAQECPSETIAEPPTAMPLASSAAAPVPGMAVADAVPDDLPVIEEPVQEAAPLDDDISGMAVADAVPDDLPVIEEPVQEATPLDDDISGMAVADAVPDDLPIIEEPVQEAAPLDDDISGMAVADALPDDLLVVAAPADAVDENDSLFSGMEAGGVSDLDGGAFDVKEMPDASDTSAINDMAGVSAIQEEDPAVTMRETLPAEEAPQETFSIRTRSMAEVLAEQGDIQGALDIYQELAQAAAAGPEKDDLSQRIMTLQARLGGSVPVPAMEEAPAKALTGKEQVLSVLTSLAKGLENRAAQ